MQPITLCACIRRRNTRSSMREALDTPSNGNPQDPPCLFAATLVSTKLTGRIHEVTRTNFARHCQPMKHKRTTRVACKHDTRGRWMPGFNRTTTRPQRKDPESVATRVFGIYEIYTPTWLGGVGAKVCSITRCASEGQEMSRQNLWRGVKLGACVLEESVHSAAFGSTHQSAASRGQHRAFGQATPPFQSTLPVRTSEVLEPVPTA